MPPSWNLPSFAYVVALVFLIWLVYVIVELAKHVHAWPF